MSIFHRIPAAEVVGNFTHKGWLGCCPVWLNDGTGEVTERNWVPEWLFFVNMYGQEFARWSIYMMGFEPPPGWLVKVTGDLRPVNAAPRP